MRKLISIVLAISICMVTFNSYASNEINDINELQEQRNEIQNQITESESEIEEVNSELTENLQEISKIDESIQTTQSTLDSLNTSISELEDKIETIQVELNEITAQYTQQSNLLDDRLVAMYEAGDTAYLDVLLSSDGISDFISNYYLVSELIEYDTELLEEVEKQKNEVEEKQQELETEQEKLNADKQTQLMTQKVLENNRVLRQSYVDKLTEKEKELQEQIDDYYNQINSIENEIKQLAVTKSFGDDYVGGDMQWPIKDHYTITSQYGMRTHPITGVYKLHTGMDISATIGTNFTAAAYGVVTKASFNTAYGNMVIIDHGGGVQTLYAHGSSIEVQVGDIVNAGDVVLKVGSTGYSTGPHAHFEIRINGETVNPLDYISIPEN